MYKSTPFGIQRDDGAFIPEDVNNIDWMAYLEWVHAGNTASPLPEQSQPIPQTVSRYQARAALLEAGLLADVEAYFAALPASSLSWLAWQEAPTVNRDSEALVSAADALGLMEAQLDSLFLRAAQFV
jgi:hypothetical protein